VIEYENLARVNTSFFEDYKKIFSATLERGWYILGDNVGRFEQEFAQYCKAQYCVGVASGLDALTLSLNAFAFDRGSEIIVPSNTYIATILAILHNGLTPVLVEPDIQTYNIDPTKIEEQITPRTKAIVVVHLYGKSCDIDPILLLAQKYGLRLIEDCAQAHGAMYKRRRVGVFGDVGAFSFYPTKNLGALGDAGAIVTNNAALEKTIRMLRSYGSQKRYYNELVGFNSRLDEIQAGFLSVKLTKLNEINDHKRALAKIYLEMLNDSVAKPHVHDDYFDVYHIFNIRHPKRDSLREYLLKNNVKTEIHYPVPPHKQQAMKGILDGKEFPISEEIHTTTLSLPVSYSHTKEDVCRVAELINRF
jgi:dTDP-4-amino-4,6-dideoxygalactose transaminase